MRGGGVRTIERGALEGRDFTRVSDLARLELEAVLDLADHLKALRQRREDHRLLPGRSLGMIFEKPSTRTRVSFEVAMKQLGGDVIILSTGDSQLGRGESIADTARVLSRYVDAIMIRTNAHAKLEELAQHAPAFPPQAKDMLAGSQGHMQQAQNELGQKNPQRGHGEQRQALDDLSRFKKGLDEMAKNAKGGGQSGGGFPFPFGAEDQGQREGDGSDPSQEKVEIPGAEAYKVPEEFRKDLLEAMKQGAPEPYRGDLQRYYEELVK
jgi:hypothetical protein